MSIENPKFNPAEQQMAQEAFASQENASDLIMRYINLNGGAGQFSHLGKWIIIEANPDSFTLTDYLTSCKITNIFSKSSLQTSDLGIKSEYTLTQKIKNDEGKIEKEITYRLNSTGGAKAYSNGNGSLEISDMCEEDFIKVRRVMDGLFDIFDPRLN